MLIALAKYAGCPREPGPAALHRAAQDARDLLVAQPFDALQHDQETVGARHRQEGPLHPGRRLASQQPVLRAVVRMGGGNVQLRGGFDRPGTAPAFPAKAEASGDRVDPCAERGLAAETLQMAVGQDEGLLLHILRVLAIAQHAQSQPENGLRVLPDQQVKSRLVAGRRRLHQDEVIAPHVQGTLAVHRSFPPD